MTTPITKQYKALGDDVWKNKVEKIVSQKKKDANVVGYI
jgi:hypothetical protein